MESQSGDQAMQAAEQAIEAANEALEEASAAVAEAAEEQEQEESSESEAAADASGEQSQASAGQSSSSGASDAEGDSAETGGEAGAESVASSEADDSSDQDAGPDEEQSAAEQGSEENLQAATEATEGARQALQGLVDLIAAAQSANGPARDEMDDSSDGLPRDTGSAEYQEALKKAVGEALTEAAGQIEKASIALAEAAAGSDQTRPGADQRETGDGVSGEELEANLADMEGLAQVMNAINDGMQAAERDGLSSASQQTYARLILVGDATVIPGSILLPGGIVVPLGLPGQPGAPRVAGDGQQESDGGSGTVVIISGAQSSGDRVAVLDTRLSGSLAVFDGIILASQASKMGSSVGAGGGVGDEGPDTGIGGIYGQPGAEGEGPMIAGAGQNAGEAADGQEKTGTISANDAPADGKQKGTNTLNRPPADIPDGSDDDIVARQLREAAENEKDPVLRDKLWDEYRAYKKATGQ